MPKLNETAILQEALDAYAKAALEQWERDGKIDMGSCGGFMLGYKGNTKFAKAILAAGAGTSIGNGKVYVSYKVPEGIRTQHMEVEVQACRAFKAVTESYGIKPTEARSFVD